MKTKYLFGMLLSGVVLAACSTDDELNLSAKQEKNPSAPVFTVKFEDNGVLKTRATLNDNNGVVFEGTDELSLFNGMDNDVKSGWANAVYSGTEGDEGIFTTRSVVNPGYAVMVYPADTEFNNNVSGVSGAAAPAIIIPAVQDETTKLKTPYMSEVINITYTGANGTGVAGYDKDYDIALKRVGTLLFLNMDIKEDADLTSAIETAGVPDIEITKVELNAGENVDAFTTAINVKAGDDASAAQKKAHKSWVKKSTLDTENMPTSTGLKEGLSAQSATLSTSDLGDGTVATFTLLPVFDDVDEVENGEVIVYTTYGTVTMDDEDEEIWMKKSGDKFTVSEGLNNLLDNALLWTKPTKKSPNFEDEEVGDYVNRYVTIDMSKLSMSGLHVNSGERLVNALKVHNAYCPNDTATFYLDGIKGEFTMTAEQLEEALELNADGKVTLTPCNDTADKCTAIKVTDGNDTEIPNLSFGKAVNVELAGTWTFAEATEDEPKVLENVTNLVLLDKSTLDMSGYVGVDNEGAATKLEIKKGATVNVNGTVKLAMNLDNSGEINIESSTDRLTVATGATLKNLNALGDKDTAWENQDENGNSGKIYNGGTLAKVEGSEGNIYNYGVIKVESATARTLIQANQATAGDLSKDTYGSANRIGTIILFDKDGSNNNTVVGNGTSNQGFIKLLVNDTEVNKDNTGSIANYIIVGSKCTNVCKTKDKNFSSNIKYLEIQSDNEVVFGNPAETSVQTISLTAVLIPETKSINIPKGVTLTSTYIYNGGEIVKAGTLTSGYKLNSYFGGDDSDADRIYTK